jgi:hypothetical protein
MPMLLRGAHLCLWQTVMGRAHSKGYPVYYSHRSHQAHRTMRVCVYYRDEIFKRFVAGLNSLSFSQSLIIRDNKHAANFLTYICADII